MRSWHGGTKQFSLPAPINTRAQAVAMNLTVSNTVDAGFFTLYAAQTPRREVSNLNVTASGQTVANHAICRISNAGVVQAAQTSDGGTSTTRSSTRSSAGFTTMGDGVVMAFPHGGV
jgi:hypothetical protein